ALQRLGDLAQLVSRTLASCAGIVLFALQSRDALVDFRRPQLAEFGGQPLALRGEPRELMLQLLDTRPLDLRLFARGTRVAIEVLPALLPRLHGFFSLCERLGGGALALTSGGQAGFQLLQLAPQLVDLRLVARQMQRGLRGAL